MRRLRNIWDGNSTDGGTRLEIATFDVSCTAAGQLSGTLGKDTRCAPLRCGAGKCPRLHPFPFPCILLTQTLRIEQFVES